MNRLDFKQIFESFFHYEALCFPKCTPRMMIPMRRITAKTVKQTNLFLLILIIILLINR